MEENKNEQTSTVKEKVKLDKYQILSIVLASILVALILGVGIYFIVRRAQENQVPNTPQITNNLTAENYNSIEIGMTFTQVTSILGKRANRVNQATRNDNGTYTIYYMWLDNQNRSIIIEFEVAGFQDKQINAGVVTDKQQSGILEQE